MCLVAEKWSQHIRLGECHVHDTIAVTKILLRYYYSVWWLLFSLCKLLWGAHLSSIQVCSGTFSPLCANEISFNILMPLFYATPGGLFLLILHVPLLISPFLFPHATTFPLLSFYLAITFPLLPSRTYSASKGPRGTGWMATSFSFPLMLSSHSAVACSVRAERTPGSPPEASARRSPPLPAHLREPSEWSTIVLAVIWWPHSTGRQSQESGGSLPPPHLTGCVEALLIFFFFFFFVKHVNSSRKELCKHW